METPNAKIRVKVGTNELELEGPPDVINQQYKDFLAAIAGSTAPASSPPSAAVTPLALPAPEQPVTPPAAENSSLPPRETIRRVFAEKDAVISLLALPQGDNASADALLLLLYGYQLLRASDYPVTGVRLMQAAKQSGLHQVDRIDRVMAPYEGIFVLAAGARRGKKYQLNNPGMQKAQAIIKEILE
jgi:hypothetical protein